jgi:hypothetical protein
MQVKQAMVTAIFASIAVLVMGLSSSNAGVNELLEANRQAIVRINVTGTLASGEDVNEAGTGFVFCSLGGVSYIATAAHVLLMDRKLGEYDNGNPKREIKIFFVDDTDAINLYQGSSSIVTHQFDERTGKDWAVIGINKRWDREKLLVRGQPNELRPGEQAVLLGYKGGGDVVQPTPLTLEAADVSRGLTLGLGGIVPKGQSGGAVLDSRGRVAGIASANLRDESGSHRAVPVSVLSGTISDLGCDERTGSNSNQPRTQVALFRYRGAIAGQQDPANVKFDLFRGMIEQKLDNIREQVTQTWDVTGSGWEDIVYLSDVHVRYYEENDRFAGISEMHRWMKDTNALNVMRGSIATDDNVNYHVYSRFYLGDLSPSILPDEISVDLPITASEFANTRDSHTLVLLYALAMDAKRVGRPTSQVALLLSSAQSIIADLERRNQTLPEDLRRIKSTISDATHEILRVGHAVSGSH